MAGDPFCEPPSPVRGCLSSEGVDQAEALCRALASTHIDFAFTSPFGRAVETAERALAERDVKIVRVPGLLEWMPSKEYRGATSTEALEMERRDEARYVEDTWKTELGEGCFDVYARVVPALLGALASIGWHHRFGGWVCDEGTEDATVAVFAHGGSLNAMLSFILGLPPTPAGRFSFANCGIASVVFRQRRGIMYPQLELPSLR